MEGMIARIVKDKGFGFIEADGQDNIFFHSSGCVTPFDTLREGNAVSFDLTNGRKGPRAEGVKAVYK